VVSNNHPIPVDAKMRQYRAPPNFRRSNTIAISPPFKYTPAIISSQLNRLPGAGNALHPCRVCTKQLP
jgi:hypothetical protein